MHVQFVRTYLVQKMHCASTSAIDIPARHHRARAKIDENVQNSLVKSNRFRRSKWWRIKWRLVTWCSLPTLHQDLQVWRWTWTQTLVNWLFYKVLQVRWQFHLRLNFITITSSNSLNRQWRCHIWTWRQRSTITATSRWLAGVNNE